MAVKICMVPFNGQTVREEVVVGSSTHELEIANNGDSVEVKVPFGRGYGNQGKVLFSAPAHNVFYAIHV